MTVPNYLPCRRCMMMQKSALLLLGLWFLWNLNDWQGWSVAKLLLEVCTVLTLLGALRFRIAAAVAYFRKDR
jgi:hypothetical protein